MKKQIVVDSETLVFLREAFGCSRNAVWEALHFETNSELSKRIRHLAKQRGGELVGAGIEPETSYSADGTMTQRFGGRVKLTALRGMVTVWVDGKAIERTMCREIADFVKVQNRVKRIATDLV